MLLKEIPTQDVIAGSNIRSSDPSIGELIASVQQVGLLNPITVREIKPGKYETVTGNRRLEAAKAAQLEIIPAVVRNADERQRLLEQLIENIQREDLEPLDLAAALARYQAMTGETQLQLARSLGKSRQWLGGMFAIHQHLTREEKDRLLALEKQPPKETLIAATKARDTGIRAAILTGEISTREAKTAVKRERRARGRPRNFIFRFSTKAVTVTVHSTSHAPRKPRSSKPSISLGLTPRNARNGRRGAKQRSLKAPRHTPLARVFHSPPA